MKSSVEAKLTFRRPPPGPRGIDAGRDSKSMRVFLGSSRTWRLVLRGIVAFYVGLLVVLPLAALVLKGVSVGPSGIVRSVMAPTARASLWLTLWTAARAYVLNP